MASDERDRSVTEMLSHEPADIADALEPFLARMRQIQAEYPNGPGRDGEKRVRRALAARLTQSGLHREANEFQPPGLAATYGHGPLDFKVDAGRRINDLADLIRSLREDPEVWRPAIQQGLARMEQIEARKRVANGGADEYVHRERIEELQRLNRVVPNWDLNGVIQLCIEINNASASGSWLSLGMCVRALMNHIPPLFFPSAQSPTFSQVAGQAPTSIKKSMTALESWRPIPDWVNHNPIRKRVSLPKPQQMDVRPHLDVLLGYVIEKLHEEVTDP